MGKKMKLPFLSQSKTLDPKLSSSPQWPWPTCGNIKTLSFRASAAQNDAFSTFNTAFLDPENTQNEDTCSIISEDNGDPVEIIIQSLQSDRLFFEPKLSSSLMALPLEDKNEEKDTFEYKQSEVLSMDSNNPCEDFRRSMEDMIEAHEMKDWEEFEGLLGCFLKINGKNNHGYILGAFIDLLVSFSFETSSTNKSITTTITSSSSSSLLSTHSNFSSPSSPLSLPSSSLTIPCLSSILHHANDDDDDVHDDHHHS